MSKLNLSEAAAEILSGSFNAAKGKEDKFGVGYKPNVSAPQQNTVDLGTAGHKSTDANYDATKGVPTATPPGAKPPVGSEAKKTLSTQPQETLGRKDLATSPEGGETSETDKVDRKAGAKPKQTMPANSGAVTCAEGEDEDDFEYDEEDELEEASMEEVMEDFDELSEDDFEYKYGMSKEDAAEEISENVEDLDEVSRGKLHNYVIRSLDDKTRTHGSKRKNLDMASAKMGYDSPVKAKVRATKDKPLPPTRDKSWFGNLELGMHKEDLDALFTGEALSEDFKDKAATIFETAVETRVEEIAARLEEKYTQEFEETLEVVKEDFAGKLDSYLDYVVENWMEENKLAIEKGLRSEIVEDFIGALKNVFVEHYIDIPEDKVDVVEGLVEKVEELEDQINEQILKNIDLKKSISEHKQAEIIHSVCEGLSLSQAEKIKSLAKNVEFVSEEDFGEKLVSIKESYFPNNIVTPSTESLNDMVDLDEDYTTKVVDPLIESYVNKISKLTKF